MLAIDYETPVHKELQAGERLLWSGQPRKGIKLGLQDAPTIAFSIFWCGFSIFWESMVLRHISAKPSVSWFMAIWGLPFIAIGLYMLVGRFFFESWQRGRTYYAVTDRRAIIIRLGRSRTVRSFAFLTMSEVDLEERVDGSGMIWFGPRSVVERSATSFRFSKTGYEIAAFDHLEGAREVYALIQDAHANV